MIEADIYRFNDEKQTIYSKYENGFLSMLDFLRLFKKELADTAFEDNNNLLLFKIQIQDYVYFCELVNKYYETKEEDIIILINELLFKYKNKLLTGDAFYEKKI